MTTPTYESTPTVEYVYVVEHEREEILDGKYSEDEMKSITVRRTVRRIIRANESEILARLPGVECVHVCHQKVIVTEPTRLIGFGDFAEIGPGAQKDLLTWELHLNDNFVSFWGGDKPATVNFPTVDVDGNVTPQVEALFLEIILHCCDQYAARTEKE